MSLMKRVCVALFCIALLASLAALGACSTPPPAPSAPLPIAATPDPDPQCKLRNRGEGFDMIDRHRAWSNAVIARDVKALSEIYDDLPMHVEGVMHDAAQTVLTRDRVITQLLNKTDGQRLTFWNYGSGGIRCDTAISINTLTLTDANGNKRDVTYHLTWARVGKDWKLLAQYFGQQL